ncbi:hypothetical protein D3C71_1682340 [compost metagenome]
MPGADLLARSGQLSAGAVLEQQAHANHVLGLHVVTILGVRGDHAHQLFGGRRNHIDLDAVLHQLVVQLGLALEDLGRLNLDGLDLVAFVIGAGDRLGRSHQLIHLHLQLLQGKAGEHLGYPRVADHVIDFTQPVVVTEQAFLVLGGVLERHQLQRRVELVAA